MSGLSQFGARVADAAEHRAARRTAASGLALIVFALGALTVATVALLARELVAAIRGAWWVWRSIPALCRALTLAIVTCWWSGYIVPAAALAVVLVAVFIWPWVNPASFRARVAGPARAVAVRRAWKQLAEACGLAVTHRTGRDRRPPRVRTSKLRRATSVAGGVSTRLDIGIVPGQTPDDVAGAAERLAAATGSVDWAVTPTGPARVQLDLVAVDVLATPITAVTPSESDAVTVPETIAVGWCQTGESWRIIPAAHTLTAGCTGAGKGSVMWSTLTALAPAIHTGVVRVAGIDLKGGMELGPGASLFTRLATTPEDAVDLLEHLVQVMTGRSKRLAGVERCHTATIADPAWLIVIDEMAVLTAYQPRQELRARATAALSLLLTQGRAVGVTVHAYLQDPSKDVLTVRDLFTQRICLRMTEPTAAVMVLGDAARDAAPAHRIPAAVPGTGYALGESGTLTRVRATYVSDDHITHLVATFPAPTELVLDPEPAPARAQSAASRSAAAESTSAASGSSRPRTPRAPRAPRASRTRPASDAGSGS